MKRSLLPWLAALSLFTLSACVTAEATFLGPRPATITPIAEDSVRVFLPTDSIPPSCAALAVINLSGDPTSTSETMMIRAARRRAGKIGANAVQLPAMRDPKTGTRIAAAFLGPFVNANRKGQTTAYTCTEAPQASLWQRFLSAVGLAD